MFQKTWTPQDETFLRLKYPSKGAVYCAEKLNRTPNAVRCKARAMNLIFGETQAITKGHAMLVNDIIAETGCPSSTLWTRIRRDGVAEYYGIHGRSHCAKRAYVPIEWANAFIDEYNELVENAHNYSHYLRLNDAAKRLGVSKSGLCYWVNGKNKGLSRYLEGCHFVYAINGNGGQNNLLFNPVDIDSAVRLMEEHRASVKGWELVKSIEQDIPVAQSLVKRVVHRIAKPRKVLHRGSWCLFVSPEDAQRIREHFGVGHELAS